MDDNEKNFESRIDDILGSVGHLSDLGTSAKENSSEKPENEHQTGVDDLLDIIREPDGENTEATDALPKTDNKIDKLLDGIGASAGSSDSTQKETAESETENTLEGEDEKATTIPPVLEKVEPVQEDLNEEDEVDEYEKEPRKKGKTLMVLGIVFLVLALLGGVYAVFSMPLSEAKKQEIYANGKFASGVSVFDINVGGDTLEVAKNKLNGKVNLSGDQTLMQMRLKDEIINVKAADLNLTNTMDSVLKEAMLYGKQEHLIQRFWNLYTANKDGKNFDVAIYTDNTSLQNLVQTIVTNYSVPAKDADAEINTEGEEKFTFIDEVVGLQIRDEGLAERIKQHIEGKSTEILELEYTETQPKITIEELKKNMVLRSTYSTNVSGASGRRKNIMLASSKINGKKVMPGETFNIENELGPRNAANGWSVGGEFVNGELVSGYGGGICQASTTLFNAAIRADLEIVERSNHSQTVGYVPLGFDATISSGGPYFIFKNNTEFPIFIFSNATMSNITVELYGAPLPYGEGITYEEVVSASGTVTSGRRVTSALVFKKDDKEVHRISWYSSYKGKPVKVTTAKATTAATTAATAKPSTAKPETVKPTPKPDPKPDPTPDPDPPVTP